MGVFARQSIQTISLQGFGIDIPGLPPSAQEGKNSDRSARWTPARVLSQDLFNLASIRAWQSYRSRRESSRLLVDACAGDRGVERRIGLSRSPEKQIDTGYARWSSKSWPQELYKVTRERVSQGVSAELDANRAMQKVNTLEQQWQQATELCRSEN